MSENVSWPLIIITHTDLDGVGSAAAYLRIVKRDLNEATVLFSEPYELHETLGALKENVDNGGTIAIMDLGPNRENSSIVITLLSELRRKGVNIEWYDHHIWDETLEKIRSLGVKIFVDRSTCATGVVIKYASRLHNVEVNDFLKELERAVCAADLWIWDHPLAPKLFRVVGSEKGEDSDEWRLTIIKKFLEGKLWDEELEGKLESYVNKELKGYEKALRTLYLKNIKGLRLATVLKPRGPPSNSLIGALIMSRFDADVAIIARENGAISLRSKKVDVQRIASLLGGGGHPRASGAKIKLPFLVKLISTFYPKVIPIYVTNRIAKVIKEIGS
jgi:oligoribonuclease NrnB/cAMP/cGMP phosphodiesterase (DHH superfamily)